MFADDNFEFNEIRRHLSVKTLWEKEKLLFTSNFYFSPQCFQKICTTGTRKNQGLFGKGLKLRQVNYQRGTHTRREDKIIIEVFLTHVCI